MKIKAYLTAVFDGLTAAELVEALQEAKIGEKFKVLASGDIHVADPSQTTTSLPNVFWLHIEPDTGDTRMVCGLDFVRESGRLIGEQELAVLRDFGVCTSFKSRYLDAGKYGSPLCALYNEAAMTAVTECGFKVSAEDFDVALENGDEAAEQYWLRIIMPSWFNPYKSDKNG